MLIGADMPAALRSERGFTLIEMLVAMVTGLVVTGALLGILEFSLRQETRISDRVQADRTGRASVEHVLEELRSGCVGASTPIQPPTGKPASPLAATNASNLWFITAYGTKTSGASALNEGYLHDINWSATGTSNTGVQLGTITDYEFKSEGGEPPASEWKFPSSLTTSAATRHVLATNVTPAAGGPFTYYHYNVTSSGTTEGELIQYGTSELPLSEAGSEKVAQVTVGYQQAPESGDTRPGHTTSFSSSVSLRFSPTEATAEGLPCV